MRLVYISSPLRGDVERNIQRARDYCAYAASCGVIPLAPHTIFTQYLDDEQPEQREQGLRMGRDLMWRCDDLWVVGSTISSGMREEIELAKKLYPVISKDISDVISGARKGQPYRLARLNGESLDKNGKKSIYNCEKYKYLLDAPFAISARCCYYMKKAPLNKFERQSGRHPITGVLACESKLREQSYLKFGCNGYERRRPLSQPLAFWREEDILRYLRMTGIPYTPIYGDIAAKCGYGISTVKRALDDLCKTGLLQKYPRWRENGSLTSNLYHVV